MVMDINQCINHLGLNRSTYRLTQSNPPHEFIVGDGPDPQPTQEELQVAWVEIQNAHDAQEYARKRKEEYPSIEECVHAMLDDGLVELQEKRAAVKARFPK